MIRLIKKYLPRSLYGRTLLILVLPTLLAQAFTVYMFYERHWSNVSRHLAESLAGEIATITTYVESSGNEESIKHFLTRSKNLFYITPIYTSRKVADLFVLDYEPKSYEVFAKRLHKQIGDKFSTYYSPERDTILVRINLINGKALLIEASDKRLFNSTTYIFILWMTGSTFILLLIAVIFLRNQIRPVIRLARYADNFGRGQDAPPNFKLEGAKEIRQAANAFVQMRERISRHLRQRAEMLAGISHDLRTPLTRMKLEVELLEMKFKDPRLEGIKADIDELESMVNSYIEFVRGDEPEESQEIDLGALVEKITHESKAKNIKFTGPEKPIIQKVKPVQLTRAIRNVIDNAVKFAKKVEVSILQWQDVILIIVDDNGPGIPANMREDVFRPFFRVEESRNKNTGGIGLGLSIVRDIIHSHGGTVELDDSPLAGLRVMIHLPL